MSEHRPPRPGYSPLHSALPFQRPPEPSSDPTSFNAPSINHTENYQVSGEHGIQQPQGISENPSAPLRYYSENQRQEPPQTEENVDEVQEDPTFTYQGMQVVRGEYFAHINEPSVTFVNSTFYVNSACIKKAPTVEFVQVLINPVEKKLVIRPSSEDIKDSFSWLTKAKKPKHIVCKMFYAMLIDLLNWNPEWRYKIIGKMIRNRNNEYLFVFDLTRTEIYKPTIFIDENGVERKKVPRKPIYPDEWKNQFGPTFDEHTKAIQVNIFDGYAVFGIKDPKNGPTET